MSEQPRVFIASSREGLPVAEAVNIKLEYDARVKLWDNAFELSSVTIESLVARAADADFAVFVFHPDDRSIIRGEKYSTVRDNVLFELGIFIGSLGLERCFLLVPKAAEQSFRVPTDLAGLTVTHYDDAHDDMVDAVAASCAKIKMAIRRISSQREQPESSKPELPLESHLQSLQSQLWKTQIDAERSAEQASVLHATIKNHFFSVAKPATEAEIAAWEEGASKTNPSRSSIERGSVYVVDQDTILPPLFGAGSIAVIVAAGVRISGLDLWSHNTVYFMDGFRRTGP